MIVLEPCKACGSQNLIVENKGGLRFLVCEYCKGTVALLDDKPAEPYIYRTDFITSTGIMMSGYMPEMKG
jgi:ssDNA-binding Zn-finger/Zn-ribbon topoisomerase 1